MSIKQSSRCWNYAIDIFLKLSGYKQMRSDPCLYLESLKDAYRIIKFVILSTHIDDIHLFSNDQPTLSEEKELIASIFQIEDMGEVKHVLGMLIKKDIEKRLKDVERKNMITISQSKYSEGFSKRFGMKQCKPVSTPLKVGNHFQELPENKNHTNINEYQKLLGCLTYTTTTTRLDLATTVGILSRSCQGQVLLITV